jgi:CBS domain-containing protein
VHARPVFLRIDVSEHSDAASRDGSHDEAMKTESASFESLPVALDKATVADVMTVGVISCPPETPLTTVAQLMVTHRVHAVFVFDYGQEADETGGLWGLVSDLDLAAAVFDDVDRRTAGRVCASPLVTVMRDQPLEYASRLMVANSVSHLAVLDRVTERPVGVLSTFDIARAVAAERDARTGNRG